MRPTLALLAAFLCFSGCSGKRDAACTAPCPGTRSYDAVSYALSGRFDWATRALIASEEVTLALAPGAGPVVELDAPAQITAVRAGARPLAHAAEAGKLRVDLSPLAPGTAPVTFTVEYRVAQASSLHATDSVAADPVRSRIVFTDSEPDRGHEWLVQKDDPSDPALFSVELTVAADEDVIANGDRRSDTAVPEGRRVAYAIDVPIASYLMAFAAGQLEHADRTSTSGVPLSLWYRRGLAIDPALALDAISGAMDTFEALLGPYPFSRYALVLQPLGGWGMENATMTIESESFAQGRSEEMIHLHELAHHWFGDLVTMHGYDDVWVKEGMATLLAAEATRARSDDEGRGRLFGSSFGFRAADAIVDPTLHGLQKYTSGPYTRAAALITQIRARVGEAAFWAHLRQFLADHARGSSTGEQFIRAFSPDLTPIEVQRILDGLPRKDVPSMSAAVLGGAGGVEVTLGLADTTATLLAPYGVTVVDAAGAATLHTLTPGSPLAVGHVAGGYVAPDEGDVHPGYPIAQQMFIDLGPLLRPDGGAAAAAFLSRSASHQERALSYGPLPALEPGQFRAFYDALDSDTASTLALLGACWRVSTLPVVDRAAWIAVLAPIFAAPREEAAGGIGLACGPELGAAFLAELQALAAGATASQLARLEYLLGFDYDAAGQAVVSQLITSAPSLRLRLAAQARIDLQPARAGAAAAKPHAGPAPGGEGRTAAELEGKRWRAAAAR